MLCKICNASESVNFYKSSKTLCKVCMGARAKARYHGLDPDAKADYMAKVKKWRGDNIFQTRYLGAKHRAAKKGIECTITAEDLKLKFEEQAGRCFYSDMELGLVEDRKYSISVDRINSKKGYTTENTVLVCYIVNSMKNDLTLKEFVEIVKNIHATIC